MSKSKSVRSRAHGGQRGEVAVECETGGAGAGALALEAGEQRTRSGHVAARERYAAAVQCETARRLPADAAVHISMNTLNSN